MFCFIYFAFVIVWLVTRKLSGPTLCGGLCDCCRRRLVHLRRVVYIIHVRFSNLFDGGEEIDV